MQQLTLRTSAAAIALFLALASGARADETASIDIPAGDLVTAIQTLAKQSRTEIIIISSQVGAQQTRAVTGTLSVRTALRKLLQGTALKVTVDSSGAMLVTSPRPTARLDVDAPEGSFRQVSALTQHATPRLQLVQLDGGGTGPVRTAGLTSDAARTATEKEDSALGDMVVVTGSRIARGALEQPTPIEVVSSAAIEQSGLANVGDILNQYSQFGLGTSLSTNQAGYNTDAGATFLNLRGLGTNRTLVLVDGLRRVSGGSSSSAVDLSTIPTNMIERIEVITGGASSVYGADAVSGVVNIILKHHAEGLELNARGGISSRGDNATKSISATFGQELSERGEFTFGVSWNRETQLQAMRRPWDREYNCDFPNANVTAANPYTNVEYYGCRFPNTTYGSAFYVGNDPTQYTVNQDQGVRPVQNGARPLSYLGTGGGDGFNNQDFLLLRPQFSVLASQMHFGYELGAGIKLSEDLQFSYTNTSFPVQPAFDYGLTITADNPYIPAGVQSLMQQQGVDSILVGRTDIDQGQFRRINDRYTFDSVTRLDGHLGGNFKWMAFFDYGRYDNDSQFENERIKSRYLQALDVISDPLSGAPECRDAAARAAGCAPLSLFGPNTATAAALKYFTTTSQTRIVNTMAVGGAQLTGTVWQLPAGALAISSGVEYRKESQQVVADDLGVEGDLFNTYSPSSNAGFHVKETFAEVVVPILKNAPFAKALEAEAAIRYSDYSSIGNTTAWKLAAQWAPTQDVRFRVTRSKSVRAPNLSELYSPGVLGTFGAYYDPCSNVYVNAGSATRAANCAALGVPANYTDPLSAEGRSSIVAGNTGLTAEIAKSWTVGTVITPRFAPRLTLTVDWWKIDIASAINTLPVQQIINGCVDATTLSESLCSLITRGGGNSAGGDVSHAITNVTLEPLNIGILQAEGVDTTAAYLLDLPSHLFNGANSLLFALDGSYTMKNNSVVDASDPSNVIRSAGNYTLPKVRGSFTSTFAAAPVSLSAKVRYIGKSKVDVTYDPLFSSDNDVASRTYLDIFATYSPLSNLKISAGMNNALDTAPPQTATTYTGTSTLFDVVGRYFFVQASIRL